MNTKSWPPPWRKRAKRAQRKATRAICTSRGKQSMMANGEPRAFRRLQVATNAFEKAKRAAFRYAEEMRKHDTEQCRAAVMRMRMAR